MGQTLTCFAKNVKDTLTLTGDLSNFPEAFKNETYHRTEDPLSDRTEDNDGYNATFYSNEDKDKHILVHDDYIAFEQGVNYRESLIQHVFNKTIKVEGNTLRVEPTIVKIIIRNDTVNNGTYTKDKFDKTLQRYIYNGPNRNAYFYNNLVVMIDKERDINYAPPLPFGTIKNDTMIIDTQPVEDTKPVEDTNTGWRSSNGGIKF